MGISGCPRHTSRRATPSHGWKATRFHVRPCEAACGHPSWCILWTPTFMAGHPQNFGRSRHRLDAHEILWSPTITRGHPGSLVDAHKPHRSRPVSPICIHTSPRLTSIIVHVRVHIRPHPTSSLIHDARSHQPTRHHDPRPHTSNVSPCLPICDHDRRPLTPNAHPRLSTLPAHLRP